MVTEVARCMLAMEAKINQLQTENEELKKDGLKGNIPLVVLDQIARQREQIDNLQAKLDSYRWIPVSEGNPTEFGYYPVTDGKGWWRECWCFVDHSGAKGWEHYCDGTITHYMILIPPEPKKNITP